MGLLNSSLPKHSTTWTLYTHKQSWRCVMKIDSSLKLVAVKKPRQQNPVVLRRERMLRHLNNQVELVKKFKSGQRTESAWFWSDEDGNIFLQIKYGKTMLELSKGKFAISCSSYDDVEDNLETVKSLVMRGSFDDILTETSQVLRSKFKK